MQIWVRAHHATEWSRLSLTQGVYGLCAVYDVLEAALTPLASAGDALDSAFAAVLLRGEVGPEPLWFLIARRHAQVFLNGAPLTLGLHVLRHRDEIVALGGDAASALRVFFSTERLAEVVPFPGEATIRCARCRQPIQPSQMAVCCPSPECRAWFHQDEALPCWEYDSACSLCGHSTRRDVGWLWTPEAL
jgi:hypothetical protein